jgi:rubrerythrin
MQSDEILAWIQMSIDIEKRGRIFYEECLKHAREQRSAELFGFLIEEEKYHEKVLKELLDKKSDNDPRRVQAALQKYNKLGIEQPMFEKADLDAITGKNALVMEMFNKSADQERKGINLYVDLEERNSDPEIKAFFHDIAMQEVVHKRKITSLGMSLFGMEEEEEPNTAASIEKELKANKIVFREIPMLAKDGEFKPRDIIADKGETVVLKITSVGEPAGFRAINFGLNEYIRADKEFVIKFIADTAGEFEYFSNVPCSKGNGKMRGKIIIKGENEPDEEL